MRSTIFMIMLLLLLLRRGRRLRLPLLYWLRLEPFSL